MTPKQFRHERDQLERTLQRYRLRCCTEQELQDAVQTILTNAEVEFSREYVLSPTDRPDFYLHATQIALELKISGSVETHLRQMKRYAEYEQVAGVILITTRQTTVPDKLSEKPTGVICLWRGRL